MEWIGGRESRLSASPKGVPACMPHRMIVLRDQIKAARFGVVLPGEACGGISLRGIHPFHRAKGYVPQRFGAVVQMILKILPAGAELPVKAHVLCGASKIYMVLAIEFRENPFDREPVGKLRGPPFKGNHLETHRRHCCRWQYSC